jgi:hypothetical protein
MFSSRALVDEEVMNFFPIDTSNVPRARRWLSLLARGPFGQLPPSSSPISRAERSPFRLICRINTLNELEYFRDGGILEYVLRQLAA